jgi:hypothetical protein
MLVHAGLPQKFWTRSLLTAAHILNRLPSQCFKDDIMPNLTLYEHIFGVPPSLDHLRIFGLLCYPHIPKPLQDGGTVITAKPHIFCGYDDHSSESYVVYDPDTQSFVSRRTVSFDEHWRQRHLRMGHLPSYADNPLIAGSPVPLDKLLLPVDTLPEPSNGPDPPRIGESLHGALGGPPHGAMGGSSHGHIE